MPSDTMLMRRILIVAASFYAISPSSLLADPLSGTDAANEFSSENAQCAAFYAIGLRCFDDRFDAKSKQDFENARSVATQRVYLLGKKAGLSDAALLARTELAMKSQMGEIENSCVNIPVLLNKYAESCKAALQNPAGRLESLITTGR